LFSSCEILPAIRVYGRIAREVSVVRNVHDDRLCSRKKRNSGPADACTFDTLILSGSVGLFEP